MKSFLFWENPKYFFWEMIYIFAEFNFQDSAVPPVKLLPRDKADNDKKNFEKIAEAIKGSRNGKLVGTFDKDKGFGGAFMDAWKEVLGKSSVEDMSIPMAYVMAPKVCILIHSLYSNIWFSRLSSRSFLS